jgi:AcrR family transcriptional regulator
VSVVNEEMTRTPAKRRLKAAERRALIEQAAAEVFASRGYDAASMEEIAEAAGVTRSVLYDHYESKRALHLELSRRHARALVEFMAERASREGSPVERLRSGADAALEFVENDPYAWRVFFREPTTDPVVAKVAMAERRRVTEAVASLIAAQPEAAAWVETRGRESLDRYAQFLMSGVSGLASWWYEHPDVPRAVIVDELVEVLWLGLSRLVSDERLPDPGNGPT